MIKLLELHIKNYRSWRELHLKDVDKTGLCFIRGANGSGKSSIRQAIEYIITDVITDGFPLDEIPFNKTESCELRGVFLFDSKLVTITKYRNHGEFNNFTSLVVDGEDLSKTDRRETQKEIQRLFGVNNETLSVSTIFCEDSISFPEAKEAERKEIVYSYFDFSEYLKLYNTASEIIETLTSKLEKIHKRVELNQKLIESFSKELEEREEKAKKFEENKELQNLVFERAISAAQKIVEGSQRDFELPIEKLEKSKVEIDEERLHDVQEHLDAIKASQSKYSALLVANTKEYNKLKNSQCPVFNELCEKLELRNSSVLAKKECQMEVQRKRISNLDTILLVYEKEYDEITSVIAKNNSIQVSIDKLRKLAKSETLQLEDAKQDVANFKAKLAANKAIENPYKEVDSSLSKKIIIATKAINKYNMLRTRIENEIPYYRFWLIAFGKTGIPNMKIEGFLQSLELETNKYLSAISDRMHVVISSQTELKNKDVKEKISYKIHHPDKAITDYHSYSAGQRQRVKIASLFAVHKLLGKFNFMILDEVLDLSLDELGVDSVVNLLKTKAKEVDTIFVISHNSRVKDTFDNVISIQLVGGMSEVICHQN